MVQWIILIIYNTYMVKDGSLCKALAYERRSVGFLKTAQLRLPKEKIYECNISFNSHCIIENTNTYSQCF